MHFRRPKIEGRGSELRASVGEVRLIDPEGRADPLVLDGHMRINDSGTAR